MIRGLQTRGAISNDNGDVGDNGNSQFYNTPEQ